MQDDSRNQQRMPVLFIGHGSPMNALEDNDYTRGLVRLGREIPRPEAIMVVSAHWLTRGTFVCSAEHPRTIHDFYGFPQPLFEIQYPAPGSQAKARLTAQISDGIVRTSTEWGLDHAAWAVLKYIVPEADIPVYEMSLDYYPGTFEEKPMRYHYELAGKIASVRDRGVLVLGSGNIVHNLREVDYRSRDGEPFEWAKAFDAEARDMLLSKDHRGLMQLEWMPNGYRAAPTLDHYLPMIYALGMMQDGKELRFVHEGFQNRSISMRSFIIQ